LGPLAPEPSTTIPGRPRDSVPAFTAYDRPGNGRELEHEIRRLAYLPPDGQAADVHLLSERVLVPREWPAGPPSSLALESNVEQLERRLIRAALVRARGKRSVAARLLGISRNGLTMKMQRLRLESAPGPATLVS